MKEFVGLREKNINYLKNNNHEDKKNKRHQKVCKQLKLKTK